MNEETWSFLESLRAAVKNQRDVVLVLLKAAASVADRMKSIAAAERKSQIQENRTTGGKQTYEIISSTEDDEEQLISQNIQKEARWEDIQKEARWKILLKCQAQLDNHLSGFKESLEQECFTELFDKYKEIFVRLENEDSNYDNIDGNVNMKIGQLYSLFLEIVNIEYEILEGHYVITGGRQVQNKDQNGRELTLKEDEEQRKINSIEGIICDLESKLADITEKSANLLRKYVQEDDENGGEEDEETDSDEG